MTTTDAPTLLYLIKQVELAVRTELDELLRAVEATLSACVQALRTGAAPRPSPELRPLQDALHAALRERPAGGDDELDSAGALGDATDRLVDATNSLVAQLRGGLGAAAEVDRGSVPGRDRVR